MTFKHFFQIFRAQKERQQLKERIEKLEYELETIKKVHRKLLFSVDLLMANQQEESSVTRQNTLHKNDGRIRLIA